MDDLSHGVKATVIDLGLSRMDAGDGGSGPEVLWTPFDEEIFEGEGISSLFPTCIRIYSSEPQATTSLIYTGS
jgi:hypothetical protein